MGEIKGDTACPGCRENGKDKTGNHLILFADGGGYCKRCGYTMLPGGKKKEMNGNGSSSITMEEVDEFPHFGIPRKRISREACEHYGVRTEFDGEGQPVRTWYPHSTSGHFDGFKSKSTDKRFHSIGNTKEGELFGQATCSGRGKFIVLTEGEDDTMAVWDTLCDLSDLKGWKPDVVSVTHGASGASGDVARNLEFLQGYDRVVLCFDNDESGRDALDEICPMLAGRAYVTKLPLKDANDMVLAGRQHDLKWGILSKAKRYQPDGIVNGRDTWDRYQRSINTSCIPYPKEWVEINGMTYGFRRGEIITITSGTGVGKTALMRALKKHVHEVTDWCIADISLEEDVGESVGGLMSLSLGKRLHLPDVDVDLELQKAAHDALFSDGRFSFYDHFGGMDDNNLFNKLRYFAATGHKAIFLDHLSIIVSEYAAEGNERERIDTIMTKLAKIAKELEVAIFIVVHLRKEGFGRSFEQGAVPSLDDLRGSGTLKQLSWDVIALSRNQQHSDAYCRDTSKLTVLKCRFSGRTGPADYLHFNTETGRMEAVGEPTGYEQQSEDRMR